MQEMSRPCTTSRKEPTMEVLSVELSRSLKENVKTQLLKKICYYYNRITLIVREPLSKLKTKKFIKWENETDKNMEGFLHTFVAVKIIKSKLMAFAVNSHFFVDSTVCQLADDGYKYNKFFWRFLAFHSCFRHFLRG